MFDLLFLVSIVGSIVQIIEEAFEKPVPAENWANKEDVHPEPHRDPVSGKIIIENCKLYYEDVENYGAYQAQQWVKQGKYNLDGEDLKKEEERIKNKYKYVCTL